MAEFIPIPIDPSRINNGQQYADGNDYPSTMDLNDTIQGVMHSNKVSEQSKTDVANAVLDIAQFKNDTTKRVDELEEAIAAGGTTVTVNGTPQATVAIYQEKGQNTNALMSQKSITDAFNNIPSPFKVLWDWRTAGLSTPPTIVANYTIPITLSRGHLYKFYVHNQIQNAFGEIVFDYDHTNTNFSVQTSASGFSRATSLGFEVVSILFNSTFTQITGMYEQLSTTTGLSSTVRTNFRLIKIIEVLG